MDAVVVGEGKNLKVRVLAIVIETNGKRARGKALGKTVKAIEVRNNGTRAAEGPSGAGPGCRPVTVTGVTAAPGDDRERTPSPGPKEPK